MGALVVASSGDAVAALDPNAAAADDRRASMQRLCLQIESVLGGTVAQRVGELIDVSRRHEAADGEKKVAEE